MLRPFAWPYRLRNWIRRVPVMWRHVVSRHLWTYVLERRPGYDIVTCPCRCGERWPEHRVYW